MGTLDGKVVIVTGAGRGIGRAHAACLAAEGATVVVNDAGVGRDGTGGAGGLAEEVAAELRSAGATAMADRSDITDFEAVGRLVESVVDRFGSLDGVVANAGILRDRMVFNMTPEEWDGVLKVHLNGTFAIVHHAARHWRDRVKSGHAITGRVVCTSSPSGLYGNVGQANYAAAKAGVVGFVLTVAQELAPLGVAVNALSPGARTRMTDGLFDMENPDGGPDLWAAENVSPAVAWLMSDAAAGLTGAVLEVENGWLGFATPWTRGPRVRRTDKLWTVRDVAEAMPGLLADYHPVVPT